MRSTEQFGPNVWLIDEMYRRYLDAPESVGEAWQDFFEDYQPRGEEPASRPGADTRTRPGAEPRGNGRAAAPASGNGVDQATAAPARPAAPARAVRPAAEMPPGEQLEPLRGAAATVARRMDESLEVPTATSIRTVPAKLLEVNRTILNHHLARTTGGKVSFTHLIGWAVVRALAGEPAMRRAYHLVDGAPHAVLHDHVNLGLAVDVKRQDASRTLLVPNVKAADTLDFASFFAAYEELIRRVNANALKPDDFAGTTATITNPGMIGTVASVPRLMAGQSAIIGVGAIDYPAGYEGADPETLAEMGVGKVLTLTSTYDHRVIQGAQSGEFLGHLNRLLLGEEDFYEHVFRSMHVPYVPVRWRRDSRPAPDSFEATSKQARVLQLINMYRVRGHLIANLDPLETKPPRMHSELDPATFGFTIWDLDRTFVTGGLGRAPRMRLSSILAILRDAYCRTSSVEYMHISDPRQKQWIQERVEGVSTDLSHEEHGHILYKLNEAEAFERFLHAKYVGHKRFSLEGAESLIPMVDAVLDEAADAGLSEVVVGMAHRGRLNVLANTVGKSFGQIFREFEGDIDPATAQGSGDVKYHLGAVGKHTARSGTQIAVTLASNPSHLESVDPVVQGMVRAKQDLRPGGEKLPVLSLLIHGDAAFAGQGVVAETLNLSQLGGYKTGGTVHIIVNNQVGFTTGADYGRSSTYASDVAKMIQAPIFHVNGDDPEACVRVARLAFEFREAFGRDVVVDMWCYRRWGHNEADEPAYTQPLMYARIEGRRSVRKLYTEALVNRGDLTLEQAERALEDFRARLQQAFDETRHVAPPAPSPPRPVPPARMAPIATGVHRAVLDRVVEAATSVPEGFTLHPKLAKWLKQRREALAADAVDWALGETLALGSLLLEGTTVRLAGQDSRRGTFSQRHAVLVDQRTGQEYTPLANIVPAGTGQGRFFVYDSLLSEFAAIGFEYGYSVANPDALVVWEAQFGDFANGGQVVIDQFIAAAEDKWAQTSGLVLLLPHGYEGQGPEHSSGRIERFLTLAARDNMQITVPSTPAQYFHLLRRQVHRGSRKPLVVMTPKWPLRLPAARSPAEAFTSGHFREVLPDEETTGTGARRVLLCHGKLYWELREERAKRGLQDRVALVRLEQVYPFPAEQVRGQLGIHSLLAPDGSLVPSGDVRWVQEEPENMGAGRFVHLQFERQLSFQIPVLARDESPSPATGSLRTHQAEQAALMDRAFEGLTVQHG
jgi:multifunctional 2-oxoglutarate metabolism enzyme